MKYEGGFGGLQVLETSNLGNEVMPRSTSLERKQKDQKSETGPMRVNSFLKRKDWDSASEL